MPKSKPPEDEREREQEREREREREHKHREHEREYPYKDIGDDPARHAKILERRWLNSPPPTPARYARALKQWQALPGAVARSASDINAILESNGPAASSPEETRNESES